MEWYEIIISILSGITMCVPLVITLVKYIVALYKEKNWSKLIAIVSSLITEAETLYADGASKKEYVINSAMSVSTTIGYSIDKAMLGELIDNLVTLTNKVNVNKR